MVNAEERYKHFVRAVTDSQSLWTLKNDVGWATWDDSDGDTVFPVWSDREGASRAALTTWHGYELAEFLDDVLQPLRDSEFWVRVNPDDKLLGIDLSCNYFREVLGKGDA